MIHLITPKGILRFVGLAAAVMMLSRCSDTTTEDSSTLGDWVKQSSYEGVARSGAVGFVIDGIAYVGTGFTGDKWLKDFYRYDASKNNWYRIADLPGPARSAAVAFTIEGKGYVGTGYDGTSYLKDFYAYDPTANKWDTIPELEGSARFEAAAFSIDGKGYVLTGFDGNYLKDMYAYDPIANAWTQKSSYSGDKLINAFAFAIDGYGYIGGGLNNGILNQEFWSYDPLDDLWTEKNDLQDDDNDDDENDSGYTVARSLGGSFVINGKGYVCLGTRSSLNAEVWEYNPSTDTWEELTSFEGAMREATVGFAIGDKGYITTGRQSTYRYDDLWQFDPTAEEE